jgi:hypothetical protein
MNEGTPSGSEYNKPMAVVLKGPTAELYLYLTQGSGYCDKLIVFERYPVRILDVNKRSFLDFL